MPSIANLPPISTTTGKIRVETKMKGVWFAGKTADDGSADPNPISSLVPHLNQALAKARQTSMILLT